MSDGPTQLSVIIVSYNTRDMTLNCLNTLFSGLQTVTAEVWVVDNASQDGSVEAIQSAFPSVRILANDLNSGFGTANNQAMTQAKGEFLLLLNSDAFPDPHAIPTLISYLQAHSDVGVVGPRLLNEDGSLQLSCFRFPSPIRCWLENLWLSALFHRHSLLGDYRRWSHDQERLVESITGACMLVRRKVYEQVGGFDERFFMYSEETDWQRRIADAGWKIAFTPDAVVTHLGGASGANEAARISRHFFDSLDYYEWKHHGAAGLFALRVAMIVGSSLRLFLWLLVLLLKPGRRLVAGSKARLHTWLLWRQATCWHLAVRNRLSN